MKRLSVKLIIIAITVMFLASAIPNILWALFGEGERPTHVKPVMLLTGGFITVATTILIYSIIVEKVVIKRIKDLNESTKEVINGNFNIAIPVKHQDEVSELTKNFNQMLQALKKNEYVSKDFTRNFSHELKTPLAAIKGYAELLKTGDLEEMEKQKILSIIIEETARLSHISGHLLQISQLDNQDIIAKNDTYNITEQIRNILQLTQLKWEEKQLNFDLNMEDIKIKSNKELTYQVFTNLIGNTIRFSPVKSDIQITVNQDEDNVNVTISNPGTLDQEEQERIFDLFYVKDKARNSQSNGIGLPFSKKIIEKLQGSISVESEKNLITFKIQIPQ